MTCRIDLLHSFENYQDKLLLYCESMNRIIHEEEYCHDKVIRYSDYPLCITVLYQILYST